MSRLFLVALSSLAIAQFASADPKVIYGEDNRRDVYETQNSLFLQLADSTAALIQNSKISPARSDGMVRIAVTPYSARVCSSERFYDQPTAAFCSGFLVAPDIAVTAGHCITSATACAGTSFVFSFSVKEKGKFPTVLPAQEVYKCKELLARQQVGTGADFAVVRLERPVAGHRPLALNRTGTIERGASLVVIGHPTGLPTKISDGAKVRDPSRPGYFVANLDTYGGNSGSAVFNTNTGLVEGILVRGENDFVVGPGGSCYISNVCSDTGCRGEDVTKIEEVLKIVPRRTPAL